eukprot:4610737-Pleurochrysis_carterae.AAC.3
MSALSAGAHRDDDRQVDAGARPRRLHTDVRAHGRRLQLAAQEPRPRPRRPQAEPDAAEHTQPRAQQRAAASGRRAANGARRSAALHSICFSSVSRSTRTLRILRACPPRGLPCLRCVVSLADLCARAASSPSLADFLLACAALCNAP